MMQNERLTEEEVRQLREAFGGDVTPPLSVRWVAEATGLDDEEVRGHLRSIRAERALVPPQPPGTVRLTTAVLLAIAGTVAVMTGVVVTMRRLNLDLVPTLQKALLPTAPPAVVNPGPTVTSPAARFLKTYYDSKGQLMLPTGVRLSIVGGDTEYRFERIEPKPLPRSYSEITSRLEKAILAGCMRAGPITFPEGAPVRTMMGSKVERRQGQAHFSVQTWDRTDGGYIHIPPTPEDRANLHQLVLGLFSSAKEDFDQGLRLGAPNESGIILPPPGFQITYTGRRVDIQDGGHLSFAPVDISLVRKRLVEAALDAINRDVLPPKGGWTDSARQEAKLRRPDRGLLRFEGRGGPIEVEVPSDSGRARDLVEELAAKAVRQLESINQKAKEPLRDK